MDAELFLIAGNVATSEGFSWLEGEGADAIRVGIAGGSVCETRNETGVYVPTPYAVAEAASVRMGCVGSCMAISTPSAASASLTTARVMFERGTECSCLRVGRSVCAMRRLR